MHIGDAQYYDVLLLQHITHLLCNCVGCPNYWTDKQNILNICHKAQTAGQTRKTEGEVKGLLGPHLKDKGQLVPVLVLRDTLEGVGPVVQQDRHH